MRLNARPVCTLGLCERATHTRVLKLKTNQCASKVQAWRSGVIESYASIVYMVCSDKLRRGWSRVRTDLLFEMIVLFQGWWSPYSVGIRTDLHPVQGQAQRSQNVMTLLRQDFDGQETEVSELRHQLNLAREQLEAQSSELVTLWGEKVAHQGSSNMNQVIAVGCCSVLCTHLFFSMAANHDEHNEHTFNSVRESHCRGDRRRHEGLGSLLFGLMQSYQPKICHAQNLKVGCLLKQGAQA